MRDAIDLQALLCHPFDSQKRMTFRRKAKGLPLPARLAPPLSHDDGKLSMMAMRYQVEWEKLRLEIIRSLIAAKIRGDR